MRSFARGDTGSAPAEFVLVGTLLTVLTLSVLQLGLALHVRNTILDAASEGARIAALADSGLDDGVERTRELITTSLGSSYAANVSASDEQHLGYSSAVITVTAPLPLVGLIGLSDTLTVSGHAAIESLR